MNKETPVTSSQEAIWAMLPEDARRAWDDQAVLAAAGDLTIRAVSELFVRQPLSQATIDAIKDGVEEAVLADYNVPPERSDEVFALAETKVREEIEADGQA